MPTVASTLVQRCRRFNDDWPELDSLGASLTNSATTVTTTVNPASGSYSPNWLIQVDSEAMLVRTSSSLAGSITVLRGARGTTAATHASGATVLIKPLFLDSEYLDALNAALDYAYPALYQRVIDESLTSVAATYEYTVPNLNAAPIPYLTKVYVKETGDDVFREKRDWTVLRGATPKIVFRRDEPAGTIRLDGFGPFPSLSTTASTLSAQFPSNAESYLEAFVSQWLLTSGEARRVRVDTGVQDNREQANRTGSSMAAANAIFNRADRVLARVAMQPMPRHVYPTL